MNNLLHKLRQRITGGRRPAASSWQRTLVVVWIAEFVALIGFSMVIPFLPFYVQDMGVTDDAQVKLWSGWLLSAQAITMGLFAPLWGSLADCYGRKLMLERAIFGATAVMSLMGFARTPEQLLVLRIIQGGLTGTVPAATALVASVAPRERTGLVLGWLQMGMFAGVSVGPLVGGLVADTLGYQACFLLTGACLFLASLGVLFFVREDFERPPPGKQTARWWDGLAQVVRSRDSLLVLSVRLLTSTGTRIIGPILPLFVATLLPDSARVATMTGIITGTNSAASSIGAVVLGRTGDRLGHKHVLLGSAVTAGAFYVAQAGVTNTSQLIVLQFCVGAALGGTISSLAALLATLAPHGRQGSMYGLDSSVTSGANAIGPMLGAALAVAAGNRAPFLLAAGVFGLSALIIAWLLPQPRPQATPPDKKPGRPPPSPAPAG